MFVYPTTYDVLVVGAGHAGIEAALAAARMGCRTLMITTNGDSIGQMSCNPAIGGLAKGHLVREIDALGGQMGICADMSGIQFRMLNRRKGPAVWSPRAQCDKKAYQSRMKRTCEREPRLDIRQDQVTGILHKNQEVYGVFTALGVQYHSQTVVLTTGTFLRGCMHIGQSQERGGRSGETVASGLSASLVKVGLKLGRLKTGTPPRLLRRDVDFSRMELQPGDEPIRYFTFWKDDLFHMEHLDRGVDHPPGPNAKHPPGSVLFRAGTQAPCYTTYTTPRTAEMIKSNMHRSPLYAGVIEGIGPRYCPSIEDKVVKFASKERHQIFLEPEGIETDEIYVNGLSTCLPVDVQVDLVRTIIGCENAGLLRPAYAVEYDFAEPTQLLHSLETKSCKNLYLAGQINGTSGYEEAGAQGILAGMNAARSVQKLDPVILQRSQAYIGVLIDDLVTKGTLEPYRMFTSRAEHRLLLRQDNADVRLAGLGNAVGLLPRRKFQLVQRKTELIAREIRRLQSTFIGSRSQAQLLKRPDVNYAELPDSDSTLPPEVATEVEVTIKYDGYIDREQSDVNRLKALQEKAIPSVVDYSAVLGLRHEAKQKLQSIRPRTLGQALRISGVSPADVTLVMIWMKRCQPEDNTPAPTR